MCSPTPTSTEQPASLPSSVPFWRISMTNGTSVMLVNHVTKPTQAKIFQDNLSCYFDSPHNSSNLSLYFYLL